MAEFDFQLTDRIISKSLGEVYDFDTLAQPKEFYHYCSLPVCGAILDGSIWLSHAEFSNDEEEIALGKKIIRDRLKSIPILMSDPIFQASIIGEFDRLSSILEAYIWCFSAFPPDPPKSDVTTYRDDRGIVHSIIAKSAGPQDRLGQWRAYGSDGRGACLTISRASINKLVAMPLRMNAVIYDQVLALRLIDAFITRGTASKNAGSTAAALIYLLPLIKHPGFSEEMEWRLLYVQSKPAIPKPNFHVSRDLYAPHHTLRDALTLDPILKAHKKIQVTIKANQFLVDISEIMIGPSRHKNLNARSMQMKVDATGRVGIVVSQSAIPYRS